jgi:UDP-glucose 4-epimerase
MKIVVTGGSGFVGSFVALELAKDPSADVVIFDVERPAFKHPKNVRFHEGDIRYYPNVEDAVKGAEEVYDIAGLLGTAELMAINDRAVDTNVKGCVNVLEACKRHGVKRIFHPTKPNDWLNTYSITKFAAEQFCLMYQRNYKMSISVLKWFNAYGPRQHLFPIRKIIPMFIVQALHDKPLQVFGDGSQTVDMIYAEDIAKIAIGCTRKLGHIGKVLDVGTGIPMTVKEVAERTIELCKSKSKIQYLPMRPGEPEKSNIVADVVNLKNHIDVKFTEFDVGMKPTIDYYKNLPAEEVEKAFTFFGI